MRHLTKILMSLCAALLLGWVLASCGTSGSQASSAPTNGGASESGSVAGTVRVAAAADLKFALDEVAELLAQEHPELRIDVVYGSSGTFLQQIQNGAPFDLFLSADLSYPQALVDAGLAQQSDLFPYAVGRLVLWVPDDSTIDPRAGLSVLSDPAITRLSIANPEHAPYGRAAVAALHQAGVFEQVSDKLVFGENVAQAAEFVQSGNAQAGLVAKSLVLSDPLREVGTWFELPLDDYPRLDQGGVVMSGAPHADAARLVRDALLSQEGTAILAAYGFSLPGS